MKFKDHIRDYRAGAEVFDSGAALARIVVLVEYAMALGYGRDFMVTIQALYRGVREICILSEQADRYKWKLRMLRCKAWRRKVFDDLGGMAAMTRWFNRPKDKQKMRRKSKILTEDEKAYRAKVKLCAKAGAHPRIQRDPCRLDEAGIFRLPPLPGHSLVSFKGLEHRPSTYDYTYDPRPVYKIKGFSEPITVWPEEFLAFAELEKEVEAEIIRRANVRTWCNAMVFCADVLTREKHQKAVFAPP